MVHSADIDEVRSFYATLVSEAARCSDPRIERAFALVPREVFMPEGPWDMMARFDRYVRTPSADPAYLYRTNTVIALDAEKGINNGEPTLHASWMDAVAPQPGEEICHIGAGTGYYSAILSMLVLPGGKVHGFELEPALVALSRHALQPFENVEVTQSDATTVHMPPADIVYVNAAVACPAVRWLTALKSDGRMIFPWQPRTDVALAMLVTRHANGFAAKPLMPAFFIPCVQGYEHILLDEPPDMAAARSVRSIWLDDERPPDDSAVAVCDEIWFSAEPLPD